MIGYIYKITNNINNKIYIGKTTYSIEKRFKEHLNDSERITSDKRPLYDAIRKYGKENFTISLIEEVELSQLEEKEQYWIKEYNSYHNGYNATYGGDGKQLYDYDFIVNEYKNGKLINEIVEILNCDESVVAHAIKLAGLNTHMNSAKTRYIKINAYTLSDEFVCSFNSHKEAGQWLYEHGYTKSQNWDNITACLGRVRNNPNKTAYGFKWKN